MIKALSDTILLKEEDFSKILLIHCTTGNIADLVEMYDYEVVFTSEPDLVITTTTTAFFFVGEDLSDKYMRHLLAHGFYFVLDINFVKPRLIEKMVKNAVSHYKLSRETQVLIDRITELNNKLISSNVELVNSMKGEIESKIEVKTSLEKNIRYRRIYALYAGALTIYQFLKDKVDDLVEFLFP